MRLLCIDIGSNTQDVLFLDTTQPVENALQLVLPAPTILVGEKIKAATLQGNSILMVGETMGGGACTQALKKHLAAGLTAYSIPTAALTFNDDLEEVSSWGVILVSSDEIPQLKVDTIIRLGDVTLDIFRESLSRWDIQLDPNAVAIAVLDHGTALRNESQRLSRFKHIEQLLKQHDNLDALIFTPDDLPEYFTRMRAVARTLGGEFLPILLDTGVAAVLGTSLDRTVIPHPHRLAINVGNSHTIAFLLADYSRVLGLFEHHTGLLSMTKLESFIERLISGELSLAEIWENGGHGSFIIAKGENPFLVVTGPRRALLVPSQLHPYFAAPFGNMMLAGCFGLAKAVAVRFPEWRDEIEKALAVN